jgi:prepilin-type N-terminal cleavage/methylation domain-containing protein
MNCPMHECPLNRDRGFTLIELVLVMTLLIMVLSVSYGLIVDCLEADRTIERLTAPEKVGEGVLALMREDLSGTIWRHLGTRVFFIHDNGREDNEGIGRVSGARNAPDTTLTAPGRPLEDSALLDVPPPAAIPRAVHVEIGFYTGTGDRIERDIRGDPILKTFSTIVPILTSQRIPLPQQDDFGPGSDGLDSDLGDEDGSAGLSGTAGARTSDPRSGGAGQGSRSPRGQRRKPEATSR